MHRLLLFSGSAMPGGSCMQRAWASRQFASAKHVHSARTARARSAGRERERECPARELGHGAEHEGTVRRAVAERRRGDDRDAETGGAIGEDVERRHAVRARIALREAAEDDRGEAARSVRRAGAR